MTTTSFVLNNTTLFLPSQRRSTQPWCAVKRGDKGNDNSLGRQRRSKLNGAKNNSRNEVTNNAANTGRNENDLSESDLPEVVEDTPEQEEGEEEVIGRGYDASFAANFHHLLPLLIQEENKEAEVDQETQAMRDFVDMLSDRYLSTYRQTAQVKNLRPFAKRAKAQSVCVECDGKGEIKCKYCSGEGFIVMEKDEFDPNFDGWTLEPPKHVVGSWYHCPLCGGRCTTRCEDCAGSGVAGGMERMMKGLPADGVDKLPKYAASDRSVAPATERFDEKKFLEENKDRIEYTPDGLIIIRAKKKRRGRVGKKKKEGEAEDGKVDQEASSVAKAVRKKGRPKKRTKQDKEVSPRKAVQDTDNGEKLRGNLSPGKVGRARRKSRRSTDFLNTTDFKVGKRLTDDELSQPQKEAKEE